MMEEGPDIDPSQLEWPFVSVLRCCNLYKTHKDKAANKYYQVLYLVEWAPGNGPLYTWTTAECMEGVVFTVQSHVIDWCVVEDDNCASSVPVHFWKYDGDWPLEAPIEDGEELEVGAYDWVAKMPPGSLQQMIAKTLGDSPTANQDNSEQVSDLFHPTALEGATSSSVTPTASQEHLDLVVVGDDEVQHENHEEQQYLDAQIDDASSGAAVGEKRGRGTSSGNLQLLKDVSAGIQQHQAQRKHACNLIFTCITEGCSEMVKVYIGRRKHDSDSSAFQANVTFRITPTLEEIVDHNVSWSTLTVTGFIRFTCCSTDSELKIGQLPFQLQPLLSSIAKSGADSVLTWQEIIMNRKTAYQFVSLSKILSRHQKSVPLSLAPATAAAAAAAANGTKTRSKKAKIGDGIAAASSPAAPPTLQVTTSSTSLSSTSSVISSPSLSVLGSPTTFQPCLDKGAALALFRSYVLTVGTDLLIKSQLHQKQFKHPQAVGFYAMSAERFQSLLLKVSDSIVHSPLGPLLKFKVCGTIQIPGSQNKLDIVMMQLDFDLVYAKGLAYLQGACIEALKLVLQHYKVTMPALNSKTKLNLASSSDPITPKSLPVFAAAALKRNGRAQEGQLNAPSALDKCMQAYILFLRNLFSASSSFSGSSSWDATIQLTDTLAVVQHHGCMLIRALSAMKSSVRAFTLSEHRTDIWGFVLRLKEVVSQGVLKYGPVISALYAAHLQSKENPANLAFPNLLKHLFGSGQRSFELLFDLRGFLIAGGIIFLGPMREDVWARCVFLPPHLANTMLEVSSLASFFTSAFCILKGEPRLLVTNDKTSLVTTPDSFPLPKQMHLPLVLFYVYRQYVLSLPNLTTVAAHVKKKSVTGKQLAPSMEDDPQSLHCLFPLFCVEHASSTADAPVFTVCNNTSKTSQNTFQALTSVLQFGIRDVPLPGVVVGSGFPQGGNMDLQGMDAAVAATRPLLYTIPAIIYNMPQVRVVMTYQHTELHKGDPALLGQLVQVARHSLPIVRAVYSPDAKNIQAESVLHQHGYSYGLSDSDWFESNQDHSLEALQILLKEPVEKVPSYITLQASSLYLSACSNVLDVDTEQERLLQRVHLSSLISSERARFEKWIEGTLQSAEHHVVSFPLYLSLASIPCVLSTLWTTLPICSCCQAFTCIAPCEESNIIFEFLPNKNDSALALQWLFQDKGCKIIACPNILDCRKAHDEANAPSSCTCLANAAILFPFQFTVPLNASPEMKQSIYQQVFSVK